MGMETLAADIVVVGLGPVGAVAANLAGAAGLDVLVVEREFEPYAQPRAIVFDAEIMRIFAGTGLAQDITAITRPLGGSVYLGADHRPIRTFRSPGPAHAQAWAPSNLFYQPQLEAVIRKGLDRFPNVRVRRGCEVTELASTDGGVALQVGDRAQGSSFMVAARYLLACDGASSTVRKRLGIGLDDIGFLERWLVVDAHLHGPMRWPASHDIPPEVKDGRYSLMLCDPAQPATLIPGVGSHRRWEYMLLPDESDAEAVDHARLLARLLAWADPGAIEIVRSAVYRFRALVAAAWRSGPVFLLGDAAHQTPPFYGQGMCHGLRDAAQLMWKLSLVLGGGAPERLLDTYQLEREPHVRAIIAASVKAGAAVCITDPAKAAARDADFRAMEAARGTATVAMTDVVPPILTGLIDAKTGGQRLPEFAARHGGDIARLDEMLGGRFVLLSCDPAGEGILPAGLGHGFAALGGRCVVLAPQGSQSGLEDVDGRVCRWLSDNGAVAVLVRPDRYIYGMANTPRDAERLVGNLLDQLHARAPVISGADNATPATGMSPPRTGPVAALGSTR